MPFEVSCHYRLNEERRRVFNLGIVVVMCGGIERKEELMPRKLSIPLTAGDLAGAAHLCLERAALTDFNQFPPGSGGNIKRYWHDRRARFEKARELLKKGVNSLPELGLLPEDCDWAAQQSKRAKHKRQWRRSFKKMADRLQRDALVAQ